VELGAQRIFVLPTGHACALEESPRGALALALHAISLLTQRRLIADVEQHREDAHLVVLPPPCPVRTQPIDFSHADELIALALGDARRFLDSGGQDRPPSRMRVHRHGTARGEDARRRNQAAA
jgi:NTE family protein